MKTLSAADARTLAVSASGLDPDIYDVAETEVLAGLLRRAASFLCPCPARSLVRAVVDALRGLVDEDSTTERVDLLVDDLVSYGDFVQTASAPGEPQLLYAAPPSFVSLPSGRVLLLGVTPESVSWLPNAITERLSYRGHVRSLAPNSLPNGVTPLLDAGYFSVPHMVWLHAPRTVSPGTLCERYERRLQPTAASESGALTIIDPTRPSTYYKGRWRQAAGTGCFVARRDQRYGAPLWSFVKLDEGRLVALVDLPMEPSGWRACDEAWWLQAAIDARRASPQAVIVEERPRAGRARLGFSGPLPRWVQRQLDIIAAPTTAPGALFWYDLPLTDVAFVKHFLAEHLWMDAVPTTGGRGL